MINKTPKYHLLKSLKNSNQLFFSTLFVICCLSITANKTEAAINAYRTGLTKKNQQGEIKILITPVSSNNQFTAKSKVKYQLFIENGQPEAQEGTIAYVVKKENEVLLQNSFDISIPANKKLQTVFTIPHTEDGAFDIEFTLELNEKKSSFNFNFVFGKSKKSAKISKEKQTVLSQKENTNESNEEDGDGEIVSTMKPKNADGIFVAGAPIIYDVVLQNKYQTKQAGTVGYTVKDAVTGVLVSGKLNDMVLAKKASKSVEFNITAPPNPGIYNIDFSINTPTYDDTVHYSFGYDIAQINNTYHRPTNFDAFWKKAMDELAAVQPDYKIEEDKLQSTNKNRVYKIEMKSLGNIKIDGWLTIPRVLITRKFPVVVLYSGYQIKAEPQISDDFVGLSINARGSDVENMQNINPHKKDLLTLNIDDPEKYIYRGIYMDCVRAIDFLFANENLGFDLSKIAVIGGSQGASEALVVSSLLNKKIKTCVADNPTYCNFHLNLLMEPQIKEESFILKYINNYLTDNSTQISKEEMLQTLNYFEIQNFMPQINCAILYGVGLLDPLAPPITTIGAYNKLKPSVQKNSEIYTFPFLAHEVTSRHNTFKSIWLYEKLAN